MTTRNFEIDFERLIDLLGRNLYATPNASIRELIQNANDACIRREAKHQYHDLRITLTTVPEAGQLIIADNGIGMDEEEAVAFLGSLGSSKTSLERQEFAFAQDRAAGLLIGRFGIGFLSSFVAADKVVVETLSADGAGPVIWECEGKTGYRIGKGSLVEPGTRVTLFLKETCQYLLDANLLGDIIIRYADLISVPIYLDNGEFPVNRMKAPWDIDGTDDEYAEYIEHRYKTKPLAILPLACTSSALDVRGVIFVPNSPVEIDRRLRSVDLFHTRMYVGEDLNLLPEWAGFICAVLDCPTLRLVASREAAIDEGAGAEGYATLKAFLKQSVSRFFSHVAETNPETFQVILKRYEWEVLRGAIERTNFSIA